MPIDPIRPDQLGVSTVMQSLGLARGVPAQLWEWMSGSATLSSHARRQQLPHLPPLDHRYGYHLARIPVQMNVLYTLLMYGTQCVFASPTCSPWTGHSRSWSPEKRRVERLHQSLGLQFLTVCCIIQVVLGRDYIIEQPHNSDLFTQSEVQHLLDNVMPHHMHTLDQCMYGAVMEGKYVRKPTDLLSSASLNLSRRCDCSHQHLQLQGANRSGSRTAQAAVYPDGLCDAVLREVGLLRPGCPPEGGAHGPVPSSAGRGSGAKPFPNGGRLSISTEFFTDSCEVRGTILKILTQLRVHALRQGRGELWDRVVGRWVTDVFKRSTISHYIALPADADTHLVRLCPAAAPNSIAARCEHSSGTHTTSSCLPASLPGVDQLCAQMSQLQLQIQQLHDGLYTQRSTTTQHPLAAPARQLGQEPSWLKTFMEVDDGEAANDPFRGSSPAETAAREPGSAPGSAGKESAAPGVREIIDNLPKQDTEGDKNDVTDLITGTQQTQPWQFAPYDRQSSTWLAAAQRRHQHRRRSNALLGVASVDLSGPHEATPVPGQRLGDRPAYYFLVLVIEADTSVGYQSTHTQTDLPPHEHGDHPASQPASLGDVRDPAAPGSARLACPEESPQAGEDGQTGGGSSGGRLPLIYCELLSKKSDATAGVQTLLAQARDDHGHFPGTLVYRLHSDRGQEFQSHGLDRYCQLHGINKTTTAGYDPSANGTGEQAVGYLKRKARQLLTGSRLPTTWWGPAVLAAAHYSRCAAGLHPWPHLAFGTRIMSVVDPKPRNAFVPRSLPGTVFGPSSRVPGGYHVYQDGYLKELVNLQASDLDAEDIAFVKGHLHEWDTPISPLVPPETDSWDPRAVPQPQRRRRVPQDPPPQEAPNVEEVPEQARIRVEEVLEEEEPMEHEGPGGSTTVLAAKGTVRSHFGAARGPGSVPSSAGRDSAAARGTHRRSPQALPCVHPHVFMSVASSESSVGATYWESQHSEVSSTALDTAENDEYDFPTTIILL